MRATILSGLPIVMFTTVAWAQPQQDPNTNPTVTVTVGAPSVGAQAFVATQPPAQPPIQATTQVQVPVQNPAPIVVQPQQQYQVYPQYTVQQPNVVYTQPQYTTAQYQQPIIIQPRPPSPPGTGLLIAGGVTFGVTYGTSLIAGSLMLGSSSTALTGGMLIIPVVGPFIAAGIEGGRTSYFSSGTAVPFLVLDGIAQTAGFAMLIAGAIQRASAPAPQPTVRQMGRTEWNVTPFSTSTAAGVMVSGTTF